MPSEPAVRTIASTQLGDYTEQLMPNNRIELLTKTGVRYIGWVVKVSQNSILMKLQDAGSKFLFERTSIGSFQII